MLKILEENPHLLMSQKDAVDFLVNHGVVVISKPVAILSEQGCDVEVDIYKAVEMIMNKKRICRDPFSQ